MKKVLCLLLSIIITITCCMTVSLNTYANDLYGDADSNGVVNAVDALKLRKYLAGKGEYVNFDNCDINYNGQIDAGDVQAVCKYLAKKVDNLSPEIHSTVTTSKKPARTNYTIEDISDSIYLTGRSEYTGDSIVCDQITSGFKFRAICEGKSSVSFEADRPGYLNVIIDENYDNIIRIQYSEGENTKWINESLPYAYHTFHFLKSNEFHTGNISFTNVGINGVPAGVPPKEKKLKLEFYGDSTTSGYGNITNVSNADAPQFQDGSKTFAAYTAYKLNADFAVAAKGGYGVLGGHSDRTSTADKFFWNNSVTSQTIWNSASYDADIIVISYGSNDNNRDKENLDKQAFKAKCLEILSTIHDQNPDAPIVWILGMCYVDTKLPMYQTIKELDAELDYLHFVHISTAQRGGDFHPNVEDHKLAADDLCAFLNKNFKEILDENK